MTSYKKGDYVKCFYEGKEYTGCVMSDQKKDFVEIQICTASKRAEKPILEIINLNICDVKNINI